ncbi:hypothetical protein [Mycobacterium hubeiense]|uniref:hypothetical protein n=1 Tax=Mycobacterium hubeiense TaxID=1867256 RepID=UPI000C7F2044|nr:hypothetical protein [Mycobacterium sp. QGD 101]
MRDDLLRYVSGPMPYSWWWLWLGLLLLAVVLAWYALVFVWTLPSHQLRRMPVIRTWHAALLRRRFIRTIRSIDERHRTGDLTAAQASAEMSRALRSFLHQATGVRAQYMHLDAITASDIADAAPVLSALIDAQFNAASRVNVSEAGSAAKELIRTWT